MSLSALVGSRKDRVGPLMRLAEVDRDELLAAGVVSSTRDDGLRVPVVLVALRACRDGLRVGLDGCLACLAGLRGGLKLRTIGTGTGREARRIAAVGVRRTSGLEGIATCEE